MITTTKELISQAQTQINCVVASEAVSLFKNAQQATIIDVREHESAAESKLNNSINIPRGLLEMKVQKYCTSADELILVHCAAGGRATLATLTLKNMGYSNVHAITDSYQNIKAMFD